MVRSQAEYRILSQPTDVWWAGFRATTLQLQQAGWELATHEDVHYRRMRLLMRHQGMQLYAVSRETAFDYFRNRNYGFRYDETPLSFEVVQAAHDFHTVRMPDVLSAFRQIDAVPQVVNTEIKSIDDLKIFATPLVRTEELIVEPANVAAMLERIREMQIPEQERIRQKERLRQAREGVAAGEGPRQKFHAQVISIEEYRKAA